MEMFTVTKLHSDANYPTLGTAGSGGYDLYALEDSLLHQGINKVRTGISCAIPLGYVGIIHDRSSMAIKGSHVNAGVIDSDYRGEIIVILNCDTAKLINKGDRIAQMVLHSIYLGDMVKVDKLDETTRIGGFGSTGI